MTRLTIALASFVAVLSATQARATTVINSYFHVIEDYDYATGPGGETSSFPIDLNLGTILSIKYTVTGSVTWRVPLVLPGPISGNATVPIDFGLSAADYDSLLTVGSSVSPTRQVTFDPSFGSMTVSGPVSLSFADDPSQYFPLGFNVLQFYAYADFPGGMVQCSGNCNWHIDYSQDQGISFDGTVIQRVTYASTIAEPASFALLTVGALAAGFVASRKRRS